MKNKSEENSIKKIDDFLSSLKRSELTVVDRILPNYREYMTISIPKKVLQKPDTRYFMDTYYGMLRWYKQPTTAIEHNGQFRSIYKIIEELKKNFPHENIINIIERKTAYVEILNEEMKYLKKRFVWEELTKIHDIFISRFENIMEQISELFILVIQIYQKYKKEYTKEKIKRFESIIDFFIDENKLPLHFGKGYNDSIDYSIYIYIRNLLVHDVEKIRYNFDSDKPKIIIDNIPCNKRKGLFNDYLNNQFLNYNGKKTPSSLIKMSDANFPYLLIDLKLSKKCTLQLNESKVHFEMELLELVKRIIGNLYRLESELFEIIIKEK